MLQRDDHGRITTLVDRVGGARLMLFTDPPYGIVQAHEGHAGEREYGDNAAFPLDPGSGVLEFAVLDVEEPNGLALSPDERTLYVADTSSVLRTDGDGQRAHPRLRRAARLPMQERPDGFRVDGAGLVWTSAGAAMEVYSPDGELLLRVEVPEQVGTCASAATTVPTSTSRRRRRSTGSTPPPPTRHGRTPEHGR